MKLIVIKNLKNNTTCNRIFDYLLVSKYKVNHQLKVLLNILKMYVCILNKMRGSLLII